MYLIDKHWMINRRKILPPTKKQKTLKYFYCLENWNCWTQLYKTTTRKNRAKKISKKSRAQIKSKKKITSDLFAFLFICSSNKSQATNSFSRPDSARVHSISYSLSDSIVYCFKFVVKILTINFLDDFFWVQYNFLHSLYLFILVFLLLLLLLQFCNIVRCNTNQK